MTTHVLVQTRVFDADAFVRYRKLAKPTIEAFGGRFVVRGRVAQQLEGDADAQSVALIEFESEAVARAWFNSEGYQAAVAARQGVASMTLTLLAN